MQKSVFQPALEVCGPEGPAPETESAMAVTGRRCPHSALGGGGGGGGGGEEFFILRFYYENGRFSETKSCTIDPKVQTNFWPPKKIASLLKPSSSH